MPPPMSSRRATARYQDVVGPRQWTPGSEGPIAEIRPADHLLNPIELPDSEAADTREAPERVGEPNGQAGHVIEGDANRANPFAAGFAPAPKALAARLYSQLPDTEGGVCISTVGIVCGRGESLPDWVRPSKSKGDGMKTAAARLQSMLPADPLGSINSDIEAPEYCAALAFISVSLAVSLGDFL
jgi:hypothetical protein